jgi:hypothetical protein
MGHLSRQPDSNDIPFENSNPWGSPNVEDATVLLTNAGERCCVCRRVVIYRHLVKRDGKNYCPDHASEGDQ